MREHGSVPPPEARVQLYTYASEDIFLLFLEFLGAHGSGEGAQRGNYGTCIANVEESNVNTAPQSTASFFVQIRHEGGIQ